MCTTYKCLIMQVRYIYSEFLCFKQSLFCDSGLEHPTPKASLTGHESEVTCVAVLAEMGLVMSGSKGTLE